MAKTLLHHSPGLRLLCVRNFAFGCVFYVIDFSTIGILIGSGHLTADVFMSLLFKVGMTHTDLITAGIYTTINVFGALVFVQLYRNSGTPFCIFFGTCRRQIERMCIDITNLSRIGVQNKKSLGILYLIFIPILGLFTFTGFKMAEHPKSALYEQILIAIAFFMWCPIVCWPLPSAPTFLCSLQGIKTLTLLLTTYKVSIQMV